MPASNSAERDELEWLISNDLKDPKTCTQILYLFLHIRTNKQNKASKANNSTQHSVNSDNPFSVLCDTDPSSVDESEVEHS